MARVMILKKQIFMISCSKYLYTSSCFINSKRGIPDVKKVPNYRDFARKTGLVIELWEVQLEGLMSMKIKELKWSIDQLDHHTTWYAMIYSIWGVTRGDQISG